MKTSISTLAFGIVLGLSSAIVVSPASADRFTRFQYANPDGGTTAGATRYRSGVNGSAARGHVVRTDGQGNAYAGSGGAFQSANGASGARAGATYYGSDGSLQHQSGMTASGTRGSVSSNGAATVGADGSVSQNRNSTLYNAATGNSYQGSTSYNQTGGLSHSATCYDGAGNVIACPR